MILKKVGDIESTIKELDRVVNIFVKPILFIADGECHLNNITVPMYYELKSIKTITVPVYSPWPNSLIKGTNKLLLNIL